MNRAQERYLNNMIKSQAQDMETMKKKIDVIEKRLEVIAPTDDGEKLTAYEVMLEIEHLKGKSQDKDRSCGSYIAIQKKIEMLCDVLKETHIER